MWIQFEGRMVNGITGSGPGTPYGETIPNVHFGYNYYINGLLRNGGVDPSQLPCDTTDFSYNRPDGTRKTLWDKTPGWIKWAGGAMLALLGIKFLGGRIR